MNHKNSYLSLALLILALTLAACSPAPDVPAQYDPSEMQFSGERAFEIEEEFVTTHINRVSGTNESHGWQQNGCMSSFQHLAGAAILMNGKPSSTAKPLIYEMWFACCQVNRIRKSWSSPTTTLHRLPLKGPTMTDLASPSYCIWRRYSLLKVNQNTPWYLWLMMPRNTA